MRAAFLLVLLLAVAPGLGPASVAAQAGEPFVETAEATILQDPAGDAQEAGAEQALDTICASFCPPPDGLPSAGAPAPASLDILGVHARVDADRLAFSIEVASLDEALTGLIDNERGTIFELCWDRIDPGCFEGARFFAKPSADGGMLTAANYAFRDETCNSIALCGWGLEYRFVVGTPGRIEIYIPRALQPFPLEEGASITNVVVRAARIVSPQLAIAPDDLPPVANQEQFTTVDVARGSTPFVVDQPRAATLVPSTGQWGMGPGLMRGQLGGEAEADLLDVMLVETPTTVTLSHRLAVVSEAPQDQMLRTEWALHGGRYHIVRVTASERQREIQSLACNPTEVAGCAESEEVPAVFEAIAGAPGYINVTYLRTDIGAPPAGAQTTRLVSYIDYGVGGASGAVTDADESGLLPPYTLRLATREELAPEGAVRFDDAPTDARLPVASETLVSAEDASALEVTHVEAQALAGGYLRLTLGLRDPGPASIPAGYEGMLRAAAVSEAGRVTMAGAYRDGSGERYFCTADTAVLATPRSMPPEGSWREVAATSGSAGAPGNITFFVPPECLAPLGEGGSGGSRRADRLAGAAFLVRGSPGGAPELVVVDEAVSVETFDLVLVSSAASPVLAPMTGNATPWWLWLVLAGAIVVAGGGIAAAILLRREKVVELPAPGVLFLGKYLVDRELGRGGFGAVWLATHTRLDRKVVIKQLQPGWASDAGAVERFRREARVLAKLDHPHITRVYDAEEVRGLAFIVMEYVEGGTLGDLRPKPASVATTARLGAQLLDALEAIHGAGIVHGDLKPDNVLLAADGSVRVADFGIARPLEGAATGASAASARTMGYAQDGPLGTPLFMAPEQLHGAPATPASDLYAAAAVVHHIATGRLLFSPAPVDVVSARLAHERGAPDAGEGRVHPALVAWLRRGLARDPADRFRDAPEMRAALLEAAAAAQRA